MASTNILITGATRGIGRALVAAYLQKPDTTVIAAVRSLNTAQSQSLSALPAGNGSKVVLVKIDSASNDDAASAVRTLQESYSITSLDLVIANAGIAQSFAVVHNTEPADMLEHYQINVVGPTTLFAAVRPLLLASSATKSKSKSKFVIIGSTVGSSARIPAFPVPGTSYGVSKAAAHWIATKINSENPEIVAFPLHPGWLQTEMGNAGAKQWGREDEKAPTTLEEAVPGILNVIDLASKERFAGELVEWTGNVVPF